MLKRVHDEKFHGALILAHRHPAFTARSKHGWSGQMLSEIAKICNDPVYHRGQWRPRQLRIEYHPVSDRAAAKTPDDSVTVDLKDRALVHFNRTCEVRAGCKLTTDVAPTSPGLPAPESAFKPTNSLK